MMLALSFFTLMLLLDTGTTFITTAENDVGDTIVDHQGKANLIWEAFKERLGVSSPCSTNLQLSYFLQNHIDSSMLIDPFLAEEVDSVVKALPSDKALGPNGFNTDFIKKCWYTVKRDFYNLCDAFYHGDVCLQSINGSYIRFQ